MRSYVRLIKLVTRLGPAIVCGVLLSGCEPPPVDTAQIGYRGLGMEQVQRPANVDRLHAINAAPAVVPAAGSDGPLATSVYKNVQVLDDLSVAEFARVMVAITQWVAPADQSCAYCHKAGEDLSSDALYTKVVSRRMLQMVRDINSNRQAHVGATGVTCWTCHRGKEVPADVWFHPGPARASTSAGNKAGQNAPAATVGIAALPNDPFSSYLDSANEIRVVSTAALPGQTQKSSTQQTEATYGLMMHMSKSLGVNCTFCHNSRSFAEWDGSTPQRATAWHGVRLVRDLNAQYLVPLTSTFPANRLGPTGDAPKLDCATCHQGVSKPLFGVGMLSDYPELAGRRAIATPAAAPADGAATAPAP
jgi:photosynthetic reaction center cytochrome c subunit